MNGILGWFLYFVLVLSLSLSHSLHIYLSISNNFIFGMSMQITPCLLWNWYILPIKTLVLYRKATIRFIPIGFHNASVHVCMCVCVCNHFKMHMHFNRSDNLWHDRFGGCLMRYMCVCNAIVAFGDDLFMTIYNFENEKLVASARSR